MKPILDKQKFKVVIERLAHQLIENHSNFSETVLIGLQPRGIFLADRLVTYIESITNLHLQYGKLDITFYRDDFNTGKEIHLPNQTEIDFSIENKKVVLIDDVLFTGRTIRSAMDALVDFGRPQAVELLVLIDRRFSRQLPIQADYTGVVVDSVRTQKVKVFWKEHGKNDEVFLIDNTVAER
ncbi:MAG: bifunctional pyr operon transcriptional regulator/uracil phosphoribosyltransferase PyrR [Bacteroidetes bacterium]|nr:bifunctional pyr operon transcriptional regulator/uracil phosphoribosyltransferase PyrR [Bacteroidota bacterium]MBK8144764.1 bifunctional pyr operon transcriptional regulator/uracil phosphoribosyltransferase PyrR [Bacteroidota bacterium]MBP6315516.1 bifunctional pyr operon transcriptional regulator/uracil phosphoribosyltransferase PyrR [Chitinophagaceae bacterium]